MKSTEAKLFVSPSTLFDGVEKAPGMSEFRRLMNLQYEMSGDELDFGILSLTRKLYWDKIKYDVLMAVVNSGHKRFGQVGVVLGSETGRELFCCYGDCAIETIQEDDILVIPKKNVIAEAGIDAKLLDKEWSQVTSTARVAGYVIDPDFPIPHYLIIQEDNFGLQCISDRGFLYCGGDIRLYLADPYNPA